MSAINPQQFMPAAKMAEAIVHTPLISQHRLGDWDLQSWIENYDLSRERAHDTSDLLTLLLSYIDTKTMPEKAELEKGYATLEFIAGLEETWAADCLAEALKIAEDKTINEASTAFCMYCDPDFKPKALPSRTWQAFEESNPELAEMIKVYYDSTMSARTVRTKFMPLFKEFAAALGRERGSGTSLLQ